MPTDGAPAMLGSNSGFFFAMLKKDIPQFQGTHYYFHRQTLALKTLPSKLKMSLIFF